LALRKYFALLSFFLTSQLLFSQYKLSKWDFSNQYNAESPLKCKYKLVEIQDSLRVYLKINFNVNDKDYYNWLNLPQLKFQYRLTTSYENKNSIESGTIDVKKLYLDETESVVYFQISKPNVANCYLFVAVNEDKNDDVLVQDIPLICFDKKLFTPFLLTQSNGEIPIFDSFITKKDSFRIVNFSDGKEKIYVEFHKYIFPAALPPMSNPAMADGEIKLTPDSIFYVNQTNVYTLTKKGNYCFKQDPNASQSIEILVAENKFPKLITTKALADAAIYICADDERKNLKGTSRQKHKLDEFWLGLGQDKDFARKLIRNYYRKITFSNAFFTNYKEGWKTDMGLVFTIFGVPDKVLKTDMKETWSYNKKPNIPSLIFIFNKRQDPFLGGFYNELGRSFEYSNVWYNTVDLWRKGIIEK
jgi:GWxTD domain-containing protein